MPTIPEKEIPQELPAKKSAWKIPVRIGLNFFLPSKLRLAYQFSKFFLRRK